MSECVVCKSFFVDKPCIGEDITLVGWDGVYCSDEVCDECYENSEVVMRDKEDE